LGPKFSYWFLRVAAATGLHFLLSLSTTLSEPKVKKKHMYLQTIYATYTSILLVGTLLLPIIATSFMEVLSQSQFFVISVIDYVMFGRSVVWS
jgi:hypothetical protein